MASAVDSRLAYARLSAVATASRLPTANRGSNNSYTTSWDTTSGYDGVAREFLEIDLAARLVARDKKRDVATFSIRPDELTKLGVSMITTWPPRIPDQGKGVVFAGFPGHERLRVGPSELSFAIFPGFAVATAINDRHITIQLEREYMVETKGFKPTPEGFDFGGMSGGPMLTVLENNGLSWWALGGVISDGSADYAMLNIARADCLDATGKIAGIS